MSVGPATTPTHGEAPPDPREARRVRLAALLEHARAGHRDALNAIVTELTPLLWHVARSRGLDTTRAEDVVQTTWLCLLRDMADIRSAEALTAWLVTVTRREANRARESGWREEPVAEVSDDGEVPSAATVAEEQLAGDDRSRIVWAAVQGLPERCRELLRVVAFVDRPDYDAVAEALDMPRGSIGPTRGRCLAKLREVLTSRSDWSWS